MKALITLRDIFNFAHDRIKLRFPDVKPLRFVEYDEDNIRTFAYEDGEVVTICIGRCLTMFDETLPSRRVAAKCMGLLAHEIIGHDLKYGVIWPPTEIVMKYCVSDSENVPYHVQFAVAGYKDCLKKVEEHNIWLKYFVHIMLKVRDEVTRFLDERNPSKQWCRQVA